MGYKYNPLSGFFDISGSGGGGGSSPYYGDPVATEGDLPLSGADGEQRVALDTDKVYIWDSTSSQWIDTGVTLASFGSTPNDEGLTLSTNDVGNVQYRTINLEPADATHPGGVSVTTQTFAGSKTFDDAIVADGGIEVSSLAVSDKTIILNDGGSAASGGSSGIEIEENSVITGYAETSADRNSWTLKAPNTAGVATITPGASGITLNQSSHNPVTLGTVGSSPNGNAASLSTQVLTLQPADGSNPGVLTSGSQTIGGAKTFSSAISASNLSGTNTGDVTIGTANGLSVVGQAVSLATSSASTTGALTSTDWNTFNGKFNLPTLTTGSVLFSNGSTISQNNSHFFWDNSSNFLGLGTSGPAAKLEIASFSSDAGLRINYGNASGDINYVSLLGNGSINASIGVNLIDSNNGSLHFSTRQTGTLTKQMTLRSGGNLGINDALPDYPLTIPKDGTTISGNFRSVINLSPSAGGRGLNLGYDTGTNLGVICSNGGTSGLAFWTHTGAAWGERLRIDNLGNIVPGTGGLSTTATEGFVYIQSCAGTPTGVPTTHTNRVPTVYDRSNNKLYVYNSGWQDVTGGGGGGSTGDIPQTSFTASDNQSSPADVTAFAFSNAVVRSFSSLVSVVRGSTYANYKIEGIQKGSSWEISQSYVGDAAGLTFTITNAGQIQYTSTSTGSTAVVKFRAIVTNV